MNEKQKTDKQCELVIEMQRRMQLAIHVILNDLRNEAEQADMSLYQVAFCLGGSAASAIYEEIRDDDQTEGLAPEQLNAMSHCYVHLTKAFIDRIAIFQTPSEFEKIAIPESKDGLH